MKNSQELNRQRKAAKFVSLLIFIFMGVVSVVIFYTSEHLGISDFFLIFGVPFAMSFLFYFVVLHHDPKASD
jgi:hypothetical protein